jgi:formamidopyrimidine-DNA glycosylase
MEAGGSTRRQPRRVDAGLLPPGAHDHVVFEMSSGCVITFTDPRRFGMMDLLARDASAGEDALAELGPEPLSPEFDAAALARACARRRVPLKVALLDQRVVAGLGNIYAVEALHLAGLSPARRASTIATVTGKPRRAAERLVAAIKQVLTTAITRQSNVTYRSAFAEGTADEPARFRVYDREGEACPTRGCTGVIRRTVQGGRSTFACRVCQR